jgi:hypothetical protein
VARNPSRHFRRRRRPSSFPEWTAFAEPPPPRPLVFLKHTVTNTHTTPQVMEGREFEDVDWKRHGLFCSFGLFYLVSAAAANKRPATSAPLACAPVAPWTHSFIHLPAHQPTARTAH